MIKVVTANLRWKSLSESVSNNNVQSKLSLQKYVNGKIKEMFYFRIKQKCFFVVGWNTHPQIKFTYHLQMIDSAGKWINYLKKNYNSHLQLLLQSKAVKSSKSVQSDYFTQYIKNPA